MGIASRLDMKSSVNIVSRVMLYMNYAFLVGNFDNVVLLFAMSARLTGQGFSPDKMCFDENAPSRHPAMIEEVFRWIISLETLKTFTGRDCSRLRHVLRMLLPIS